MTDTKPSDSELEAEPDNEKIDGRVARRERNRDAVLDVVLDMFGEDAMFPTIEQASKRSGLSLRSVYRYFADPGELLEAAIIRNRERSVNTGHLSHIGEGALTERIATFVAMRLALYDQIGSVYRATVYNGPRHERIRDELARTRRDFQEQFELQFAPELQKRKPAERRAVLAAGDVLTQLDSIVLMRRAREMSHAETEAALVAGLTALLSR